MRKILLLAIALTAGFAIGRYHAPVVHAAAPAQITTPAYTCPVFGSGYSTMCSQYILEVSNSRFGGGRTAILYQINSSPFDLTGADFTVIGNGLPISVQSYFPGSTTNTFTADVGQP
jgi:hypothetical protein